MRCDEEAAAAAGRALIWKYKYLFLFFPVHSTHIIQHTLFPPLSLGIYIVLFVSMSIESFHWKSSHVVFSLLSLLGRRGDFDCMWLWVMLTQLIQLSIKEIWLSQTGYILTKKFFATEKEMKEISINSIVE